MADAQPEAPPLGTPAPDFALPDPSGRTWGPKDFSNARGLLVAITSNSCPFAAHVRKALATLGRDYAKKGLAVLAVNVNDEKQDPGESLKRSGEVASETGFVFPYVKDGEQTLTRALGVACTPDFYLYDGARHLACHGQFDDSRPKNDKPVTGADLRAAIDVVLAGNGSAVKQVPSVGCGIKWREA